MIRRRFPWLLLALATTSCVRLGPHAGADGPALDGRVDTWRPSRPDGALRDGGPPDADLSVGLDASGDAPGPVDGPLVSRDIPRDIPLVSLDIPLAAEGLLVPDGPSALLALRAVANQTAVFETTPITTVDVDNFTGDDKTANGVPINYSCRFDRQVDNVVSSAALPCLDLGAGATFDSATGTLNWTPRLGALGSYEIAIRGTAGLATDTVIFVITVVADHRPTGLAVGQTVRVSVGLGGEANGDSNGHTVGVSANGRFVVYTSVATNLVTGDTNGVADVFVTDVRTGETTRVSVDSNGVQGDGPSDGSVLGPAQSGIGISDDGYTVVFMSSATNFVTNDANGVPDIFWHDRRTGETQLASRSLAGVTSTANGASQRAQVSADGRYIVFQSAGSNLVAGDTNGKDDCFRFDTQNSQTRVVSRDSAGVLGNDHCNHPRISSDGNLVAFYSLANNLVAGDTNNTFDAFLHNVSQGVTRRISQRSDGTEGNGAIYSPGFSGDQGFISFHGNASNLIAGELDDNAAEDVFQFRLSDGVITRVSKSGHTAPLQADARSYLSRQSETGRFISFNSLATNLIPNVSINNGLMDVFVKDRQTGVVYWASRALGGVLGDGASDRAYVSRDGTHVVFESQATNLVAGDTAGHKDIFIHRFR